MTSHMSPTKPDIEDEIKYLILPVLQDPDLRRQAGL